jgi:hypothetical protein
MKPLYILLEIALKLHRDFVPNTRLIFAGKVKTFPVFPFGFNVRNERRFAAAITCFGHSSILMFLKYLFRVPQQPESIHDPSPLRDDEFTNGSKNVHKTSFIGFVGSSAGAGPSAGHFSSHFNHRGVA